MGDWGTVLCVVMDPASVVRCVRDAQVVRCVREADTRQWLADAECITRRGWRHESRGHARGGQREVADQADDSTDMSLMSVVYKRKTVVMGVHAFNVSAHKVVFHPRSEAVKVCFDVHRHRKGPERGDARPRRDDPRFAHDDVRPATSASVGCVAACTRADPPLLPLLRRQTFGGEQKGSVAVRSAARLV